MQAARAPGRRPIGEMLVTQGRVTGDQLAEALRAQQQHGRRVGSTLVLLGYLAEDELARFLSDQLGVPAVERIPAVPEAVRRRVPVDLALLHTVFPLALKKGELTLAMADPSDEVAVREVAAAARCAVHPVVSPELVILNALRRQYDTLPRGDTMDLVDGGTADLLSTTRVPDLDFLP